MKKDKGFTLIELIMVIVILGILAAIAIPKFISLQKEARNAVCDGNVAVIRSALSAYYAKTATTGTAVFPDTLTTASFADGYFADGTIPRCPYGSTWIFRNSTGVVDRHSHGT